MQEEDDFGELEILTITPGDNNQLTQIRCTCDKSCSGNVYINQSRRVERFIISLSF